MISNVFALCLIIFLTSCKPPLANKPYSLNQRGDVFVIFENLGIVKLGEGPGAYFVLAEVYPTDNDETEELHGIELRKVYIGSVSGMRVLKDDFIFVGALPDSDPFTASDPVAYKISKREKNILKIKVSDNNNFEDIKSLFVKKGTKVASKP